MTTGRTRSGWKTTMTADMPPFRSHNIALPDGTLTAPAEPLLASTVRCRAVMSYLADEFGGGGHSGVTVADLGCLEGGYAAEFARAGYDVTGIEARPENYDAAAWLPGALGLANLRFICGDVRDVLPGMEFDVSFCSGLLYHLDEPVAFVKLLGQVTRRILILNTNFSAAGGHPESVHNPGEWCGERTTHEGYAGHWCHEQDNLWASFGNRASFWLDKDALIEVIAAAGFVAVTEKQDWREGARLPMGSGGAYADRGMFVAFKPR